MRVRRIVSAAVLLGIALAGILFWLGLSNAADKATDVWFEVAKAGLQLGVVAIIGGGVAAAMKQIDIAREHRRQVNEYRLGVLRSLVVSYNRIKAVRRILRAHGFRSPIALHLTADQVSLLNTQLQRLNDEQLALEALKRELQAQPGLFANSTRIQNEVGTVEKYLHGVIEDWEDNGARVEAQAPVNVLMPMKRLQIFLDSSKLGFESGAAKPLELLVKEIGPQLLSIDEAVPKRVP